MLSIGNPPPDPPFPHLKNSKNSDETSASSSKKLALPEVVDLSKPALDLPQFSIRDYVFSGRSKDIRNHWPFSSKHLQLCLKHGVKDPLPPFQPLDHIVKSQSAKIVTNTSKVENNNKSNVVGEHSGPNRELGEQTQTCIKLNTRLYEVENGFPLTTHVSQSISHPVADTTPLEAPVEVELTQIPSFQKTEITARPLGKKCKLIMKVGKNIDRTSAEDIVLNSETMASKTCPVCKTFSSTSNTTLNAHIDQCLSAESTLEWTSGSKLSRHKIKPRKTKLMVDIYATAKLCTLEELDRRNGTTWATISSLPAQNMGKSEQPSVGRKSRMLSVHSEVTGNAGAVYIDANGTKVRILSKSDDARPVSQLQEDLGVRKPLLKGGRGRKFASSKKNKHGAPKQHHKYLKLAAHSRKFFSRNDLSSPIDGAREGYSEVEKSNKTEERKKRKQVKPRDDSGNIREWACYKGASLAKKIVTKEGHKPLKCKWQVETNQSSSVDSLPERSQVQKQIDIFESPISSPESSERMDDPLYEAQISNKRGWSTGRKRVGSPLSGEIVCDNSFASPNKKRIHVHVNRANDYDISPVFSSKPSRNNRHVTPQKDIILCSALEKYSAFQKSQVRVEPDVDEEEMFWHSGRGHQGRSSSNESSESQYEKEEITEEMSPGRSTELINDRLMEATFNDMTLRSSLSAPQYSSPGPENIDVYVKTGTEFLDDREAVQSDEENIMVDYRPGSIQCIENRSRSLCGPNFVDRQEVSCADEVGNGLIGQNVHAAEELDSTLRKSFEVDPIPIPGPPGSFLPSPGDVGSENFQGNSSLTNNRVLSYDFIDGDSSDSLISATSAVSYFTADRSNTKYPEAGMEPLGENAASMSEVTCMGAERISFYRDNSKVVNKVSTENQGPYSFRNGDNPCCCQRTDRISHGDTSNYEQQQLVRGQTLESVSIPPMVVPVMNNGGPFPSGRNGYCETASPSTSNPVLRLMGKNLMVVKKDEPVEQQQLHPQINYASPQVTRFPQHPHGPASLFPKPQRAGDFIASMEPLVYKGEYNFPDPSSSRSASRRTEASIYNVNEIIIVDDLPDGKPNLTSNTAKSSAGFSNNRILQPGTSIPLARGFNSRPVNPFSCYHPQDHPLILGKPAVQNGTFYSIPSRQAKGNRDGWGHCR